MAPEKEDYKGSRIGVSPLDKKRPLKIVIQRATGPEETTIFDFDAEAMDQDVKDLMFACYDAIDLRVKDYNERIIKLKELGKLVAERYPSEGQIKRVKGSELYALFTQLFQELFGIHRSDSLFKIDTKGEQL